jgi:hypothetical protein
VQLFEVLHYLQEQDGLHLEVTARKVPGLLCGSVRSAISSSIMKDFLSMALFMVFPIIVKIRDKKGLFAIGWEWPALAGNVCTGWQRQVFKRSFYEPHSVERDSS